MKKLLIAATALSLLGGTAAMAQPYGYDRDHHDYRYDRDHRYGRDYRGAVGRDVYAPHHRWARGERLPREYWGGRYVVNDWRVHHLRPPPRGYHWVRVGDDYVLAAIATGLIADLLANNY
jgi:Ni/Co efflux regulator RcnB